MGLWDSLFGRGKKPKRHGRGSRSDENTDGYTRQIQKAADGDFDPTPNEPIQQSGGGGGWGDRDDPWAPTQVQSAPPPPRDPTPVPRASAPPARPYAAPPPPRASAQSGRTPVPADDVEDDATRLPGAVMPSGPVGRVVAVLVGVDGPLLNHIHALYEGENLLGRGDPLDGGLPDESKSISRQHAKIVESGRDFMLQPLRAENLTFVNDQAVETSQLLSDGDRIRVGAAKPSTFVFRTVP
jgi:hypothetical protein